uniref:Uncharacterized protein n=1 Tax=virus sp. cti5L29 TaxID=2826813 RepID=A0A8S5R953_9VIRU|nr:MAG TPA: hypothetical protein [virus sp. cti5L29]
MAWIKVKDMNEHIFVIPESTFENQFKSTGVFTKIEESVKPKVEKSEVKENDTEIQFDKKNEVRPRRKNSEKTSI